MDFFSKIFSIEEKTNIRIAGLTDDLFAVYLYNLFIIKQKNVVVTLSNLYEANKLFDIIKNYTEDVLLFPMDDFLTSEAIAISPDLKLMRLETLNSLINNNKKIIITHLMGYLRFLPDPLIYQKKIITVKLNKEIKMEDFKKQLIEMGYSRESFVSQTGEFAVRGFVIDVFPVSYNNPIRLEFFGDVIEKIKSFAADTQRTLNNEKSINIYPFTEFLSNNDKIINEKQKYLSIINSHLFSLSNYCGNHYVVYKDIDQLKIINNNIQLDIIEFNIQKDSKFKGKYMFDFNDIKTENPIYYSSINNYDSKGNILEYSSILVPEFRENINLFNKYIKLKLNEKKLLIICLKEQNIKKITQILEFPFKIKSNLEDPELGVVNIFNKSINNGFEYGKIVVISEQNIFKEVLNIKKNYYNLKRSNRIKNLNKLEIGDYVVHNIHGIGIYNGIKSLKTDNVIKDYLEILYLGKDKLYVPVERIDLVYKYSAKEGAVPRINKLNSLEWSKTKKRIKSKVKNIADKLIKIHAARQSKEGFSFSKDTLFQETFEQEFIYEETIDQLKAIKDIKKDMESNIPMDRLLCGDVGYGKTEVAFRAIFKAAMDSKQTFYLCPTTILSNQQYKNAEARFKNFPIRMALLNRFVSLKDTKKTLKDFSEGKIDLLIGTHRILSSDVVPCDLGLLIIDEEQRFGVIHKEKIKQYKANVDVLTLSATPIPRTLQLSLSGLKSLSLIETPPRNRYPIQTYVIEENKTIIKEVIYKELSRNGQVYILYNRIDRIIEKVNEIQRIVPEAKVTYAHGKMSKREIEETMMSFIKGVYDIMVCTTIIENGIDIANVNTLIVFNADYFGLSQLYQIRGRVGRSNKIAYCYLMYNPSKMLNDTARKRLKAIQEFTELGSGFAIASRDLSIRGAGDILGSEQAGFIDSVGVDLYLKILNDEINKLKGLPSAIEPQENLLLNIDTHIDNKYVSDDDVKIEIHKLINTIDSYDQLLEVKTELEDRYGRFDDKILIYMYNEWLEKLAQKLNIQKIIQTKEYIELVLPPELSNNIDGELLFRESFKISSCFRFNYKEEVIHIILDISQLENHYVFVILDLLKFLFDISQRKLD